MSVYRQPSIDKLCSALVPALQDKFCWNGGVTILDRRFHIYTSSSPSEIVTCELEPGFTVRVLCKYGELPAGRDGHRAGTAGEAVVYREVLESLAIVKPAFFGSYLDRSSGAPATVVHGEFYPKNILLVDGVVVPVDWESAMIGAGEIDLAALVDKWAPDVVEACKAAYATARWPFGAPVSFIPAFEAACLYWQLRWLGDRRERTLHECLEPRFDELRRLANQWSTRLLTIS